MVEQLGRELMVHHHAGGTGRAQARVVGAARFSQISNSSVFAGELVNN